MITFRIADTFTPSKKKLRSGSPNNRSIEYILEFPLNLKTLTKALKIKIFFDCINVQFLLFIEFIIAFLGIA